MAVYRGRDIDFIGACYNHFGRRCSDCGEYLNSRDYAGGGWYIILDRSGNPVKLVCAHCLQRHMNEVNNRNRGGGGDGRLVFDPAAAQRNWHPF